ncbi:PREDICTED: protein RTF2 homolog [Nicrophorus vespilloides]|uniref:Replication termination factor 2 n=1 Tax=Nicrophorus vespilloides TaxID=110193 RepID=A0ABM1N3I8_NICVS|nr:PREDICTED: protein RTF2 homolog [Nicrophorus vespilloides]
MGCDGGTIPRRDELVRVKKKPETKDKDSELAFQWRCCAITQQVLENPIVVCGLGRLYNKIALIEALLNRETLPEYARHIRSLKDVKNLNLTPNPEFNANVDKKGNSVDSRGAPYICPVIGLEMSGKFRFVALWSCGCVFSERAWKEVPTTICHKCQQSCDESDIVIINGNEDDVELMKVRMESRQAKNKKVKKIKPKVEGEEKVEKQPKVKPSTSKILPSKRLGAVEKAVEDERVKRSKPDYSVANDPNASDVYKSLFTSHKSEKEQTRAHWITYNPFYN